MAEINENASDKERVQSGQLLLRVLLEIAGSPKDHVEKAITLLSDRLEKKEYVAKLMSEEVMEAEPHEENENVFTAIAELEFWIKNQEGLVDLAFDFMPASIEIIEPEKPEVSNKTLSNLLNELMAKLHRSDMVVKNLSAQKQTLDKNSSIILRNFAVHCIKDEGKSIDEISKEIGMPAKQLEGFLALLIKDGDMKKESDKYTIIKKKSS